MPATSLSFVLQPAPRSAALCALALGVASLLAPRPAAAASSLPRLVVRRAPDASDCPDAPALAAAVERQMQRPALDPASTDRFAPVFDVQILRSGEGYTAILHAGGRARELSDDSATCGELSEALALTLAILLDSDVPPPRPRSPPPVVVAPAPPPSAPPRPRSEPARRPWGVSVGLGAAQTFGVLTELSGGLVGDVSLRWRSASFGLGAMWLPAQTLEFAPGSVEIGIAAATARACAAVFGRLEGPRFSLCAESMLGSIGGAGSGYEPDREGSAPWFALGAAALAEGPIAGSIGWSVRVMEIVTLTPQQFTVDRRESDGAGSRVVPTVVFEPSPVGLFVGFGVQWTIL